MVLLMGIFKNSEFLSNFRHICCFIFFYFLNLTSFSKSAPPKTFRYKLLKWLLRNLQRWAWGQKRPDLGHMRVSGRISDMWGLRKLTIVRLSIFMNIYPLLIQKCVALKCFIFFSFPSSLTTFPCSYSRSSLYVVEFAAFRQTI